MIYRIFGKSGYGKSEYLYGKIAEKIAENPDRIFDMFLIVPEQQTLVTERKVVERFGNIANVRIQVVSFDRMSNRVSRKTGGMSYDYADSTLKKLVMNKTLRLLDPALNFYAKVSGNMEFVEKIVKTIDEMKLGLVSPLMLQNAAAQINESEISESNLIINKETARKINEIGLIYAAYDKNFEGENALRDVSNEMVYLCSLLETEYIDYTEKNLEKKRFFTNANVFVDSFDSFSNGQKAVLSRIFDQAENVYMTCKCLPYDLGLETVRDAPITNSVRVGVPPSSPDSSSPDLSSNAANPKRNENYEEENIFYRTRETAQFIADICKDKNLALYDYILGESKRFKNTILTYLERNLWRNNKNLNIPEHEFKDKLEIYECEKIFDEAETAAKKVLYLAREKNYKYSDIQIVAADISSYKGILDSVFEKYKIPLFISVRTQLSTKPLISMLLSLFDMINYDFRLQNIHSYIKNGLCGLTYKEIDDIEIYITSWQINGLKRYNGKDWNMHPDGYIEYDETDANIKETLDKINETRKKFIAPVFNFMKNIKKFEKENENTVKNITVAIIDFLDEIKTYERLNDLQNEQKENGEFTEAAETVQIWNILMELLQKIVLVCGDEIVDLKRYAELFKFILNDIDIGKIPTSLDEVTALNANLMRDSDRKCTIILGLNTDVFPEAISDDDLLGDREKNILRKYRIDFSIDTMQKSYDQLYYFYNAATSSSECVILIYRQADINGETMLPSMAVEKIKNIFPNLRTYRQSENFGNVFFTLEGKENGYIEMGITDDKILKSALYNYFVGDAVLCVPPNISNISNISNPGFKDADLTINSELADKLFYNLNMSSTKLDSYVNCPFSYFCKYVLGLKSESSPKMQMNDIGKFIHKILEIFMTKIRDENIEFKEIKDIYIKTEAEKIIDAYLSSIIKDYEFKTDRFRYLLKRLNKIIFEIIKNLRDEFASCDFLPADFELKINDKPPDPNKNDNNKNTVKPIEIGIPGKGALRVTGIIDRVDVYREDQNVYIRIVDYKTGSKKFNLSDVLTGLNLQMFIYLFSVWHNAPDRYNVGRGDIAEQSSANAPSPVPNPDMPDVSVSSEISNNIPAGVLYMPSKNPQYEKKAKMSDEEIYEEKGKNFTRSGLFLRDEKILNAMEHNLEGRYIPIKLKDNKNIMFKKSTASGVLASLEQIGKLERYVTNALSNIAFELSSGKANVYPFKGRLDSCAFCEMKRICRFEENDSNKKNAVSFAPDKVWDMIDYL